MSAVDDAPTPARPGTSARASTASRTPGCSPAAAPTSTTSSLPGMLHACFVRSPFARAAIRGIDTAGRARGARRARSCSPPPTSTPTSRSSGTRRSARRARRRRARRWPTTRCASSATRSRWSSPRAATLAEDAAELVDVDYEPLPPVVDYADGRGRRRRSSTSATAPTSSASSTACPRRALDDVFAAAAHVVTRDDLPAGVRARCRWRGAASSSTTRAATGELTIYAATQSPHEVRLFCSRLLGMPEHRIRVVMRDTGGGFGQKVMVQRDEMCLMLAAPKVGAPVKWVEDRRENLLAAGQVAPRARRRARWRSTPTARSRRRTSTSCPTAARTRRRGRSSTAAAVGMLFPGPYRVPQRRLRDQGDLHEHRRAHRVPRPVAVRDARPRGAARHRGPRRWASTRSSCGAATCCAATSCRTRTRTA